jgi:hypothetical protein
LIALKTLKRSMKSGFHFLPNDNKFVIILR